MVSGRRAPGESAGCAGDCYPTSIGWHPSEKAQFGAAQLDAWRTIQRGHAIANGVYVAVANRVGFEGTPEAGLEFWGNSFVAGPFGEILAEASNTAEETLIVECDPARSEDTRRNWPFLRDRRIDAYQPDPSALARRMNRPQRKPSEVSRQSHAPAPNATPYALGYRMPRNGTVTKPPGSPGRMRSPIGPANLPRFCGSMPKSFAIWPASNESHSRGRPGCRARARACLKKAHADLAAVEFIRVPTDRGWIRDFGPIFVKNEKNGEVAATHWLFNAWAKYDNFTKDSVAFTHANRHSNIASGSHTIGAPGCPRGGSIDVNGRGTLSPRKSAC